MNREEILEKSRVKCNDKGFDGAKEQGRKLEISAFCSIEVAIMIFNWFRKQLDHISLAMFWVFLAVESHPKYKFMQKKSFLCTTMIGSVAFWLIYV